MSALEPLYIHLLGGFRISLGEAEIPPERFRLRKARSLIKLLALAPKHQAHREQLMEQLWSELEPQWAANNLNQAVFAARRGLSSGGADPQRYLSYQNEHLSLCSPLWVDVEAFENAAARARASHDLVDYTAALDLFTGELLPEDRYEEWAALRRESLSRDYLRLWIELAALQTDHADFEQAIQAYNRVLMIDSLNEEAHVNLMRLYALTGQRQQALHQYQSLTKILSRELGVEPDSSSTQLYKEIQSGRYPSGDQKISTPFFAAPRHNLPSQVSSFIGREREIEHLQHALAGARLVTLTGSGGVGKTRLSLQLAENVLDQFKDGIWFIELAPVVDPDLVPQVVASALGVREEPGRPLIDSLAYFLKDRQVLLILDNCEHLLEACASLADTLLRKAFLIKIMVSSREPLGIAGENSFRVPSMATPDPRHMPILADLKEFEAVRLFTDRARAVLPSFQVDEHNALAIAEICQRLDGIPLALELAIARLNLLDVKQLASRLGNAFRLLTGGSRTALPRQQTLRATIDWSYQLLSDLEQRLLRRLAVFAGSCTLEAIESVCSGQGLNSEEFLDLLTGLVNKSMINVEHVKDSETRYRLLETVRQYAREKLNDAKESIVFYDRHLDYYLDLAETIEPQLRTTSAIDRLEVLNREIDNLRASLSWAMDGDVTSRIEAGLRLASALMYFWHKELYFMEGYSWLVKGLSAIPEDDPVFAKTCAKARFTIAYLLGPLVRNLEAQHWLRESVELYRKIGDVAGQAMAQSLLGLSLAWMSTQSPLAKELCEQSLATARTLKDPWLLAWVLRQSGEYANIQQEYSLARSLLEESLLIFEQVGDGIQVVSVLFSMGMNSYRLGDYPEARHYFKKTMVNGQAMRSNWLVGLSLGGLGEVDYMQDKYEDMEANFRSALEKHGEGSLRVKNMYLLRGLGIALKRQDKFCQAVDCFLESLPLAQEANDTYGIYAAIAGVAGSAIGSGFTAQAVRIQGAVAALFATYLKPLDPWEQREFDHDLTRAKAALTEEEFTRAWAEGQALTLEGALLEARALGNAIRLKNNP